MKTSHAWFLQAITLPSFDAQSPIMSVHLLAQYQMVSLFLIESKTELLTLNDLVKMWTIRDTDIWYRPKSLRHKIEFLIEVGALIPTNTPKDVPLCETEEDYKREYDVLTEMFSVLDVDARCQRQCLRIWTQIGVDVVGTCQALPAITTRKVYT